MSSRQTSSTLHLQMGQEVMYLLLVTSLLANFILAALALRHTRQAGESTQSPPYATPAAKPPEPTPAPPPRAPPPPPPAAPVPTVVLPPQPPIIPLRETDGFSFDPGSSEVSPDFMAKLRAETVPRIINLSQQYGAQIVEVIGHTDGTSIRDTSRVKANLDDSLGSYMTSAVPVAPAPYDNAGLGLSRAMSVAKALREAGLPATLGIHPLSAAYLIAPSDRFEPSPRRRDDPSRRRIDIRIRRINAN